MNSLHMKALFLVENNLKIIAQSLDALRQIASICDLKRKSDVLIIPRSVHVSVHLTVEPLME